jgi:hypothetical protein
MYGWLRTSRYFVLLITLYVYSYQKNDQRSHARQVRCIRVASLNTNIINGVRSDHVSGRLRTTCSTASLSCTGPTLSPTQLPLYPSCWRTWGRRLLSLALRFANSFPNLVPCFSQRSLILIQMAQSRLLQLIVEDEYEDGFSSLSAHFVTILNPASLFSCLVCFWVGLKACNWPDHV